MNVILTTRTAYHTCIYGHRHMNLRKIYINLENHCGSIFAYTLYRQKLEFMLNIFATDSIGLPLLFSMQLFQKIHAKILHVPLQKQSFT